MAVVAPGEGLPFGLREERVRRYRGRQHGREVPDGLERLTAVHAEIVEEGGDCSGVLPEDRREVMEC